MDNMNENEIPICDVGPVTRNFVGRKKELADLQELIVSNKLIHLTGMGGIGKTELAKAFAKLFFSHYNANCIWLNGEDENSLRQSVNDFLHSISLAKSKRMKKMQSKFLCDILKETINPLLAHSSYVLFIVDNVNNYYEDLIEVLKELQQIDTVRVLVTSRNKGVLSFAGVNIHLNELKTKDAEEFFETSLPSVGTRENINELCHQLQNYPLALGQASAYIKEQRIISIQGKAYSIADYLKEYNREDNKTKLLDYKLNKIENNYPLTTFTAFSISDYNTGNHSMNVLKVLAYMNPNYIKYRIIKSICCSLCPDINEKNFDETLKLIKLYSLINIDYSVVKIHRVVQQVVRLHVGTGEETLLRNLIGTYLKIGEPIDNQVWEYASKYDELFKEFVTVIFQIGHRARFYKKDALTFANENYSKMVRLFGEYGEKTLKMKLNIGKILTNLRRYDEALKYFEEVHTMSDTNFGPQSKLALESKGEIAWALSLLGRKKASLTWFKQLMPLVETIFETCEPFILNVKLNMGRVLYHLGKYSEAITTFESALLIMNEDLKEGSDLFQFFETKELIGRCFLLNGDFTRAKETFLDITKQLHLKKYTFTEPETKRLLALSMEQLGEDCSKLWGEIIETNRF